MLEPDVKSGAGGLRDLDGARWAARARFRVPDDPAKTGSDAIWGELVRIGVLVPREAHAEWQPPADRPDPVTTLLASNQGRQSELLPLRMTRMAASPFGFLRGSAAVMAWDLAHTPTTGLPVVLAGDAHLSNFGLYGTPQQEVVFDLNDFDETTVGPWEWDLKRLVASVSVVARANEYPARRRRLAVQSARGHHLYGSRVACRG